MRRIGNRTSLARTVRQLASKHATLIIGCLLCVGSAGALLMQTSAPATEIPRLEEGAEALGDEDALDAPEASEGQDEEGDGQGQGDESTRSVARIHVDGAVASPGVYEMEGDDLRVMDAVEAAGGLAQDADVSLVNLAAQVHDADKVHIPAVGEAEAPAASEVVQTVPSETSASTSGSSALVNINQASVEELCALPGVGEATAKKIVADRESSGPFASPEDLMRVSGIGEKKFASLKDLICV